jgi:AhpD family alkylhydroperoxidase
MRGRHCHRTKHLAQTLFASVVFLRQGHARSPTGLLHAIGRGGQGGPALDQETKELITMALAVAARCDPCLGYHAQALVKHGATRAEVEEMLGMCVYMGGGPSLMYAAAAIAAYEEFGGEKAIA